MGKPIQEQIFKSRLTITYRTNITGTVTQEPLPFRLLVLGNFSGDVAHEAALLPDLEQRKVRSIKRRMNIDNFIAETLPTVRLPDSLKHLVSHIPGQMVATLRVTLSPDQLKKDGPVTLRVKSGEGTFTSLASDNGLCDLKGPLLVRGQIQATITTGKLVITEAELDIAGLARGDLTDPRTGALLSPVTAVSLGRQKIAAEALDMAEDKEAALAADTPIVPLIITVKGYPIKAERTIPFNSLESMTPDRVANSVPEIRRLLVIKLLLQELQADLRNLPELRKTLKDQLPGMFDNSEDRAKKLSPFKDVKAWATEQYPLLQIEKPKKTSESP